MPYIMQIINETTVPIRYTYQLNGVAYEGVLNPSQQPEDFASLRFNPPHEVPLGFDPDSHSFLMVTFLKQNNDGPFVGVFFRNSEFWMDQPFDGEVERFEEQMDRDPGMPAVGKYCILYVKEELIDNVARYRFKAYQYEKEGSKIVYITGNTIVAAFVAVGYLLLGAIL